MCKDTTSIFSVTVTWVNNANWVKVKTTAIGTFQGFNHIFTMDWGNILRICQLKPIFFDTSPYGGPPMFMVFVV